MNRYPTREQQEGREEQENEQAADAIQLLKTDHQHVKELYEEFEQTDDPAAKHQIVETALSELKVHTAIEEEIFYPAVRREIDDDDLMDEALEEHHAAKLLIEELEQLRPRDERFDAKFTVLIEMVKHHIEEEENELFPKVEELGLDLEALGQEMMERKTALQEELTAPRGGRRGSNGASRSRTSARNHSKKSRTSQPKKRRGQRRAA
jgi:hemerythrin superfamily protein